MARGNGESRGNKTYHKTPINPDPHPQHTKQVRNAIPPITQGTGPPQPNRLLQPRSQTIHYPICQRKSQHIIVREVQLNKMRGDDLSHRISINETGEEHEGHEVVVENLGVEVEVGRDEGPG